MDHDYEKIQHFNFITSFLHSTRYKNLIAIFNDLQNKKANKIKVIDIGCGPAKSFDVLNSKFNIDYCGIERRNDFCNLAIQRYGKNDNFQIVCDSIENQFSKLEDADIVIGLETFEHIPENIVVKVIEAIAKYKVPMFYCTVPNEIGPAILIKNIGSYLMGYSRHKEYTWKETIFSAMYDLDNVGLHGVGHKGFDWRWLAQTIRHNLEIKKITKSPFNFIPRSFSPSIGFIALNRNL